MLAVTVLLAGEPPEALAQAAEGAKAVHLPRNRIVNLVYVLTDGGGYRWDIQNYGTVGQGTNYAYGSGMYCQVNGASVQSNTSQGVLSQQGDELEIGPYTAGSLHVYRRVKVYKNYPLARWLDIFENPTNQPVNISVQIYSNINYGIVRTKTSSDQQSFGEKDWAFVTEPGPGANSPSLLHVVCDKRSKVRPTVMMQGSSIRVAWQLTVPAKKTAILCYFESQNRSVDAHDKLMRKFPTYDVLKDLPPVVRGLIVNFPTSSAFTEIDIERSDTGDTVVVANGDPIYGRIANKSFALSTAYGQISLPAEKVIGMVPVAEETGTVRVLTTDAQIISGQLSEKQIDVELPSGGTLNVPIGSVKQWSYGISKERPSDIAFTCPAAILRTGDCLVFDPAATKLTFRTRHGTVSLETKDLVEIAMDNAPNGVHRVTFLNGSRLAGFLEPEKLELVLKIGPKFTVGRDLVAKMVFAGEEKPNTILTRVVLNNDDELFGKLTDEMLSLATEYGAVKVKPANIRQMDFMAADTPMATVQLWDGTTLRGSLAPEQLSFALYPGPELKLHTGQIRSIVSSQALPPEEISRRVERLVAQLGAESYKDRQAAMESLVKMDAHILPLLRGYLDSSDPEVRQRIEEVMERLGGTVGAGNPADPQVPRMLLINRIDRGG